MDKPVQVLPMNWTRVFQTLSAISHNSFLEATATGDINQLVSLLEQTREAQSRATPFFSARYFAITLLLSAMATTLLDLGIEQDKLPKGANNPDEKTINTLVTYFQRLESIPAKLNITFRITHIYPVQDLK